VVCSSGIGFDPVVGDTRYLFDVAGLYNGVFAMADRQTGSIWTHFDGSVIEGPLAGSGVRLAIRQLVHTTWAEWVDLHPTTLVPIWDTGFQDRYRDVQPGRAGLNDRFADTLLNEDDRLGRNELVVGAGVGSEVRAYVLSDLGDELTVVSDVLGGHPIVVFADPPNDFGLAYSAVLDGETLTFRVVDGEIVDSGGSQWTVGGDAVSGPLAGRSLQFVTSFVTEWYGWAAYYPESSIYGR